MTLTGHPFDTLKVRLQSQSSANPLYSAFGHLSGDCCTLACVQRCCEHAQHVDAPDQHGHVHCAHNFADSAVGNSGSQFAAQI